MDPTPTLPLLASTKTEGDIVDPSPLGLVPHTKTRTKMASRLHRLYEAVEVESIPKNNTNAKSRNYLVVI